MSHAQKVQYNRRVYEIVISTNPELTGRIPWANVEYLYNQGVSVKDCAAIITGKANYIQGVGVNYN